MVLIFMNKIISVFLTAGIALSLLPFSALADEEHELSAHSAIVLCADTGDVLFEKNADERMLIASITKIMTAIVVIENADLDEQIVIKPEWSAVEGSSMYANPGQSYTVRELLYGMMLNSGNDAAAALACTLCGNESSFAEKMNEKARELGLENTSFRNPHGLDDEGHYSTARDMARLTAYCMKNDTFKSIVSTNCAVIKGVTYYNHNRLLREYEGCIGVKTGYTIAAGRTLVSCAERGGMRLVCVTLNAPDDWNDHKYLMDKVFSDYRIVLYDTDSFRISLDVASAAVSIAEAVPENEIKLLVRSDDELDVKLEVPRILFAGGIEGEKVGVLSVFINGSLAAQGNLVYTKNIKVDPAQRLMPHERILRIFDTTIRPYYVEGEAK